MAAFPGRVPCVELLAASSAHQGVTVAGWVRTKRESKEFAFLELNDGSCLANLQIIVDANSAGYEAIGAIGTGTAVAAHGDLVESPGKGQRWELRADRLTVVGHCDDDYPLQIRAFYGVGLMASLFGARSEIVEDQFPWVHQIGRAHV